MPKLTSDGFGPLCHKCENNLRKIWTVIKLIFPSKSHSWCQRVLSLMAIRCKIGKSQQESNEYFAE